MEQKNSQNSKRAFTANDKDAFKMRLIDYSVMVMKETKELRNDPVLWPVCDQLIRSATSIGANINEAQGAGSKKDFANYFQIALKSARETRYWIQVTERYNPPAKNLKHLYDENESLINVLQASLKTLRSKL
jgi:four helix bundle protein